MYSKIKTAYLVHPAANLAPHNIRMPPNKAVGRVAPCAVAIVSDESAESAAPIMAPDT